MPSHTYQYLYMRVEHQYGTREARHLLGPFNKAFNKVLSETHSTVLKLAGSAGSRPYASTISHSLT